MGKTSVCGKLLGAPLPWNLPPLSQRDRAMESRGAFEPLAGQTYVLLTTYRRDGTPVGTPVHIAVDGDRAFVRTFDTAWKLKRIVNNPEVCVAPSTVRGTPTGLAIPAHARILSGEESARAGQVLARKYPILHGLLIPLAHRLRGNRTMHIELRVVDGSTHLTPAVGDDFRRSSKFRDVVSTPGTRSEG